MTDFRAIKLHCHVKELMLRDKKIESDNIKWS